MEDFCAKDDLQAVSFHKGDILTVLQKESKNWWYVYNNRQELGYIPAALVCNLKDWHKHSGAFWNPVCPDFDDVFVESRDEDSCGCGGVGSNSWDEKNSVKNQQQRENHHHHNCGSSGKDFEVVRDLNSNLMHSSRGSSSCKSNGSNNFGKKPPDIFSEEFSQDAIYVPTEYIASYLRRKEHIRLQLIQRLLDERVHNSSGGQQRQMRQRHFSHRGEEEEEQTHYEFPPDCRRDLKPKNYQNTSNVLPSTTERSRTLNSTTLGVKPPGRSKSPPRRNRTVPSNLGSKLANRQPKPADNVDFTHIHGDYDPMATYLRLSEMTSGPPPVPPH